MIECQLDKENQMMVATPGKHEVLAVGIEK